jgi:hypothetical protein
VIWPRSATVASIVHSFSAQKSMHEVYILT